MARIKVRELIEMQVSLNKLVTCETLGAGVSFRLLGFAKSLMKEMRDYEEVRLKLVAKYAGDPKNGRREVLPQNIEVFNEEMKPLLEEEADIPEVKIKLNELERANLSPMDMANLDFLIEDDHKKEQEK